MTFPYVWVRASLWMFATSFMLIASSVDAGTEQIVITADGSGVTASDAINNALAEAVRRVNGTHVDASQSTMIQSVDATLSGADGESANFSYRERVDASVSTAARGAISSYEVLSERRTSRGVEVTIRALVPRYRVPGIDSANRRKLAVLPFSSRLGRTQFFGDTYGEEIAAELSQAILTNFVQSRRFSVVDRESWSAIADEHRLLASPSTPIEEKAKLGSTLGADYIVLGELIDAAGGVGPRTERLTGVQRKEAGAHIAVSYRIIAPATGEIKYADTLEISVVDPHGRAFQSRTSALIELSKRLVGIATDRIFPIQVVSVVSASKVVLNQGGATLSEGDQLLLVRLGEPMLDPYTKEPLGRVETEVGRLEVVRVDGKVAYAILVGEAIGQPETGMLARRHDGLYATGAREDVPPPTPRTEGVRLPFDRR